MSEKGKHGLFLGAVFGGFLLFYLLSAQRGASWQDSGQFQFRVLAGDYASPAGLALVHPLYIALARLVSAPFTGGARLFAVTAFSGVSLAAALALLAALVLRLTKSIPAALVAVFFLGLSHMAWTVGSLAEVYALSLAFLMAELLCLARLLSDERPGFPRLLLPILLGLHLSVANDALLALPVYFTVCLLSTDRPRLATALRFALLFLLGALPFLSLVAREAHISGVLSASSSALFGGYRSVVTGLWPAAPGLALANYALAALSFLSPVWLFAFRGFRGPAAPRLFRGALLAATLVHILFWLRYFVPDQATFILPVLGLGAVWTGLGFASLPPARQPRFAAAALLATMALSIGGPVLLAGLLPVPPTGALANRRVLPGRDELRYWILPSKSREHSAADFAAAVEARLRPGDVLVADSTTAAPLLAARAVRDPGKPAFRILSPYRPFEESKALALIDAAPAAYIVSPRPGYEVYPALLGGGYEFIPDGPLFRIVKKPGVSTR